jgi:hypothetical protein
MRESAQNITDRFLDYRRRMLVFISAAEKIVNTYNAFRQKFIDFKDGIGRWVKGAGNAVGRVINAINPFDDISIDCKILFAF